MFLKLFITRKWWDNDHRLYTNLYAYEPSSKYIRRKYFPGNNKAHSMPTSRSIKQSFSNICWQIYRFVSTGRPNENPSLNACSMVKASNKNKIWVKYFFSRTCSQSKKKIPYCSKYGLLRLWHRLAMNFEFDLACFRNTQSEWICHENGKKWLLSSARGYLLAVIFGKNVCVLYIS